MELSIYQGHNSSISFYCNGKYHIFELEKLVGFKNFMLAEQNERFVEELINQVLSIIRDKFDCFGPINTLLLGKDWTQVDEILINKLSPNNVKYYDHHLGHAACSFYQSEYEDAIIISYDGGGNDGFMNFYSANKKLGITKIDKDFDCNLGVPYYMAGYPIQEITNKTGYLVDDLKIAGKLMGLVGYGKEDENYLSELTEFYESSNFFDYKRQKDSLSGESSFNYAYCTQKIFENKFLNILYKNINSLLSKTNSQNNICLAGGCALNVLMNERLLKQGFNVFVPPNPDDGGLSLGYLFLHRNENNRKDVYLNGVPILDEEKFETFYLKKYKNIKVSIGDLVDEIGKGKIIGIIEGEGEVGPRALGRRSIICNPSLRDMKDILNQKVKFREWFRPFAPVVRKQDAIKFFHVYGDLENYRFMSFAPRVKEGYKELLPSITHVDGTSRLQVISDENELLYKILSRMEVENMIPVLINTSFNTKGKPTLTTYEEALNILDTTELDYVYSNEFLFSKTDR
jgi:carbamoyltransferase